MAKARNSKLSVPIPAASVSPTEIAKALIHRLLNLRLADSNRRSQPGQMVPIGTSRARIVNQLHLLFDSVATHLDDHIDTIAERISAPRWGRNGTVSASRRKIQHP